MTFLPVVERELRVAARKKGTYWNRFGAALIGTALCVWVLWVESRMSQDRIGRDLFQVLSVVLFIYIAIAAALATCDSLTAEKRDGTLGLLFLTDLKSYDIILGKLTANSLAIVYRVLTVFPILGICFVLGGVSHGEMWRTILAALNLLFLSLTIGIFASAASRDGIAATRLALGILVLLLVTTPAVALLMHVPGSGPLNQVLEAGWIGCGCVTAKDTMYNSNQTVFWIHAGFVQLLSWIFLRQACRIVPRAWQDRPMAAESGFWKRLSRWFALRPNAQARSAMLEQNPYLWRARQRQTATLQIWGALGLLVLFWAVEHQMGMNSVEATAVPLLIAHLAIKLVAAGEASRAIAEDRHSGAMELLLTTPLSPEQIVRGQGRAFFKLFIAPIAVVIAMDTTAFIAALNIMRLPDSGVLFAFYLVSVGALVLDVITARWTGLWLGLSQRSAVRATSGTVLRIQLLPALLFMLLVTFAGAARIPISSGGAVFLWAALCFVCDIFFMMSAQSQLQERFRSIVAGE